MGGFVHAVGSFIVALTTLAASATASPAAASLTGG